MGGGMVLALVGEWVKARQDKMSWHKAEAQGIELPIPWHKVRRKA